MYQVDFVESQTNLYPFWRNFVVMDGVICTGLASLVNPLTEKLRRYLRKSLCISDFCEFFDNVSCENALDCACCSFLRFHLCRMDNQNDNLDTNQEFW